MKFALFALFILSSTACAKPTIVVVIDTGFGMTTLSLSEKHLCNYGHKDFTGDDEFVQQFNTKDKVPLDNVGHGTNIVGIIDRYADSENYCIVVVKAFEKDRADAQNMAYSEQAIKYAISLKPDIINYSAGGKGKSDVEYKDIKQFLDEGGIFVASAGNNDSELGKIDFYPAMYDSRIDVVGNLEDDGKRAYGSNFGEIVKFWEKGNRVKAFGIEKSGTSQSTAIHTGKLVNKLKDKNGKQNSKAKKVEYGT